VRAVLATPVVVAPMAGGPSTPALVSAGAAAGALAFLAGGYKTSAAMVEEIAETRARTAEPFGVNLFVPGVPTARPEALEDYVASLAPDADALGCGLGAPIWDDDDYHAKVAALSADPPAVVSFTFGCPQPDVVTSLRSRGAVVAVTVTSVDEAHAAAACGADCLSVQGIEAGAHRGTFTNDDGAFAGHLLAELLPAVAAVTDLPLFAAGGIMDADAVAGALAAGAIAAQCGTAFLRCPESGAHPLHKAALADGRRVTALTRSFSGRVARGLENGFMREHRAAPAAYPEVNNATRPLRATAGAAGDTERMSLFAGEGFAAAAAVPVAEVVDRLRPAWH